MRSHPSNLHTPHHLTLHIGHLDVENWIIALDSPYRNPGLALAYVFTKDSGYRGHYIGMLSKTSQPQTHTETHTHTLTFPATTHDMPTLLAEVQEVCSVNPQDQNAIFQHAVLALRRGEDWDAGFLSGLEWEGIVPAGTKEEYAERVFGIKDGVRDEDESDMGGTGLGTLESIEGDWCDASPVDELVEVMQDITMEDMWFDGTPKVDFSRRLA